MCVLCQQRNWRDKHLMRISCPTGQMSWRHPQKAYHSDILWVIHDWSAGPAIKDRLRPAMSASVGWNRRLVPHRRTTRVRKLRSSNRIPQVEELHFSLSERRSVVRLRESHMLHAFLAEKCSPVRSANNRGVWTWSSDWRGLRTIRKKLQRPVTWRSHRCLHPCRTRRPLIFPREYSVSMRLV